MRLLLDMNLAPRWCDYLAQAGHEAVHWWSIGPPDAPDQLIMSHARDHGQIVLTHDLDFGAILAATGAASPSVVQLRTAPTIESCGDIVLRALRAFEADLTRGAIVTIRGDATKATVLPLKPPSSP